MVREHIFIICLLICPSLLMQNDLSLGKDTNGILFPRAFAVAIDDLGWNEGSSLVHTGGPYRVGFRRNFEVRDYKPIVEIGQAVGVRFQGVFLLAEMDRMNICAKYPTTTQTGEKFNNSENIDVSQLETMHYIQENAANLEFGIHGVGHEHWINGEPTRAEWYDLENDKPWPEEDMRNHLKCFKEIMAQYRWTTENGQSFPESFVPCAYGYYWNPDGKYSTGKLMRESGVKYVNTLFDEISELNPPFEMGGGFDHGALVINRFNYGNDWYEAASLPKEPLENYETDIIETHWANWLATDDFLQSALNQKWIEYFKNIQAHPDHYLAKNTEQLFSQWLYKKYAIVSEKELGIVTIDNRKMPMEAYQPDFLGNLMLAIDLDEGQHVSSAKINGNPISAYFEDEGYGFIYLPPLERKKYKFEYKIGSSIIPIFVNNTGTYNVYKVWEDRKKLEFEIKMYGIQIVQIVCPQPKSVSSDNHYLKILSQNYEQQNQMFSLEIYGRDMQGERGKIRINF